MSYSYDLRKRVEAYVLGGGKKTEAARLFSMHVQTIHNWMRMKGGVCSAGKPGPKTGRTVKRDALKNAIAARPDARLKELAEGFQVHPSTISYACKKWGITRKKRPGGYKERDPMKRKAYLRLRERYRRRKKSFVYVDESGFEPEVVRRYGRAPRGQKVYGLRPGHSRPRTCFLAAQIDGIIQATQLWEGTCTAQIFNHWLED